MNTIRFPANPIRYTFSSMDPRMRQRPAPEAHIEEEVPQIPYAAELKRKALHLLALVVPLSIAVIGKQALFLLIPLTLLALAGDYFRARSEAFARFIYRIFGFMMRAEEVHPVGGPIVINGATWVLITATLLATVFPVRIAAGSFAMFMVCDAAAALVGRRFGRLRWGRTRRTVEGSTAFIITGFIIMALMPGFTFWVGAVSVLFAAVAEAAPGPLNDNIRVPFVAATVIFLLERFVLGMDVALFF